MVSVGQSRNRGSDSLLARLHRASASILYSIDFEDLAAAKQGIEDLREVESILKETPRLTAERLGLLLSTMILADAKGMDVSHWRSEAEEAVAKLASDPTYGWDYLTSPGTKTASPLKKRPTRLGEQCSREIRRMAQQPCGGDGLSAGQF